MKYTDQYHSLWDLAVLCFLRERPMHPYEIQRLLLERHKDDVLVVKRGSLYHAIDRLLRAELIVAAGTGRDGRRPQRTTYRITIAGEQELVRWLQQMIAVPVRESSEFMASVSFLIHLTPRDAIAQLESRAQRLEHEIGAKQEVLKSVATKVDRIHLIESEYLLAMQRAELKWIQSVVGELRSGTLRWDLKKIFKAIQAENKTEKIGAKPTKRRQEK